MESSAELPIKQENSVEPQVSERTSPEPAAIIKDEKASSLNGDNDIADSSDADADKDKSVVTASEIRSKKDHGGGLVILDISKDIAKVDTDDSESVEDVVIDIIKNKGRKRRLSELRSGDEDDSASERDKLHEVRLQSAHNEDRSANKEILEDSLSNEDLNIPKQTLGKGKRARIPNKRYSDILISPNQRSKSTENGSDKPETDSSSAVKEEIVVPHKIHRSGTDIGNPNYLKPFQLGWKRELVWRGASVGVKKTAGDIYYYMPSGKKIRSMRELSENLKTIKKLSMENFTFIREPLGLNDPEKEIIRDAKKPNSAAKKMLSKSSRSGKVASPKLASPKVSSPKTSKTGASELAETSKSRAPPRNLGNFKIKAPSKGKTDKKGKGETKVDEAMEVDSEPAKNSSTRKSGRWTNNFNRETTNKPCQQPCSIRCDGVQGIVPTLQCRICLCLYHHECVGYATHPTLPYVCKNCHLEDQTVADTGQPSAINAPPPLTPINTLKSVSAPSTTLPKLQRIPRPGDIPDQPDFATNLDPEMPRLTPRPTQPTPKKVSESCPPPPLESKSLVGSVTTWLPHNSKIVDSIHRSSEPTEVLRPQYLEILGGRKFLVIPKHNFMSVSPTMAVTPSRNPEVSVNTPDVATPTNVPTDSASLGPDTDVKIDPESPSKPENSQTQEAMEVCPAAIETGVEPAAEVVKENVDEKVEDKNESASDSSAKSKRRIVKPNSNITSPEMKEESQFMANYLQNVSYGYKTLLYIFQYLKVQDLLRAGCVCTMWRDIASHSSLWRTVRMKNSQVQSFEGLANTLKKHGTVHLDLRKMLLRNDGDEIWPQFSKTISTVDTLRKIELCRCPALVVEQLAVSNPDLEVINAVTIKCENMSIEPFASLKNIKELRLKSTQGLTLTSNLDSLKDLRTLSHLSLTSIRDLNTLNLSVVAELTNLESLDLGECKHFPKNFGEDILIKLENLEKLRLEKGQGNCHTFEILEAVKDMKKLEQLELVNFDIKPGFDKALGACSNIKKLLIIPTYISQSATTNHMVLGGVLRLQKTLSHFVWGVTLELLRVTELFVDQCEEPDKKDKKKKAGNGDSIPVLKPVPSITDKDDDIPPAHDPPQVEILPLPNLQKLLLQSLPNTRVKILKIPFHATWRQSITDSVN